MLNQAPALTQDVTLRCHKLSVSYFEASDAIVIQHFSNDGKLLSECCLTPEDAYEYAESVLDVYDSAVGIK